MDADKKPENNSNHFQKMAELLESTILGKTQYIEFSKQELALKTDTVERAVATAVIKMLELNVSELRRIVDDIKAGLAK